MRTKRKTTRATKATSKRAKRRPTPIAQKIGERIKRLRLERDFNFDAFVEETGLGRGFVSELERGMISPTIATLDKVARALDLTLADLVLINGSTREKLFEMMRNLDDTSMRRVLNFAKGLPVANTSGDEGL